MTTIDNGYVQGKLRRAISTLGGSYPFVIGLEPAGLLDSRGVQYASIDFDNLRRSTLSSSTINNLPKLILVTLNFQLVFLFQPQPHEAFDF